MLRSLDRLRLAHLLHPVRSTTATICSVVRLPEQGPYALQSPVHDQLCQWSTPQVRLDIFGERLHCVGLAGPIARTRQTNVTVTPCES